MQNLKELAIEIFNLQNPIPSRSGGAHEVSLDTGRDWDNLPDIVYDPKQAVVSYIDHTLLKPDATRRDIKKLCAEAEEYGFYSVCVNPCHVTTARYNLIETIQVCTVVGFPLGANTTKIKCAEAEHAIEQGASEIDMVINIGALKLKEYSAVLDDIAQVVEICHKKNVLCKVIIETALLTTMEKMIACLIAKKAGADYVKTSTGFADGGATVADIDLMRKVVGPKVGVKASGGVRSKEDAVAMLKAGASRIGTSAGVMIAQTK